MESKIIADFPVCPQCGSKEKISAMAVAPLKDVKKIAEDSFSHLKMETAPLQQPKMAGVMVPTVVTHYDVCGSCGLPRCTRAEIVMAAVVQRTPVPMSGRPS
jgi:hypothetical protein